MWLKKKKLIENPYKYPVIVTISGKARNGKDQFAKYCAGILENKGYKVLIIHHADYLKWVCEKYMNVPHDEKTEATRSIWQMVGTDWFRASDENYWVRNVEENIRVLNSCQHWDFVIIPDCRFPNEINYYKECGYHCFSIQVKREGYVSPLTPEQKEHSSETSLDNFNFDSFVSAKDLTSLEKSAKIICETLTGKRWREK